MSTDDGGTDQAYNMMAQDEGGNRTDKYQYFSDGQRRIDYVIAYDDDHDSNPTKKEEFDYYLKYLNDEFGLETEKGECVKKTKIDYGSIQESPAGEEGKTEDVQFILVHAPIEILYNSAQDLKMKMPTKLNDICINEWYEENPVWSCLKTIDPFRLRNPATRESTNYFVRTFDKDRLTEFIDHEDVDKFFTASERGRLVHYLLQMAHFSEDDADVGMEPLIHKGVFLDAFPLHDGCTLKSKADTPVNDRQRLQKDWGSFRSIFKYQPIDAIREYFGEKIALYFAWLGYYTMFLVPAAFVGILCFVYGVVSSFSSTVVSESCKTMTIGNTSQHLFYMCPLCDRTCSYFLLSANCMYARASHMFDNKATLFFAMFMSIWSTVFLEFWKRKQFSLAYEWHSMGFEEAEEQVRPEYAASNPRLRLNPITQKQEPYMPPGRKCRRLTGTVGVVAFFILLILVAVVGVVVFRAAFSVALLASGNAIVRERSKIIVAVAAGCLNLVAINILKFFYNKVAVVLTDWENPRTRTDYEDSFTIKMFMFQFFNTYTSIIYVAFFKTEVITGSPGKYKRFGASHFRLSGCSAQGCFLELTIQLIIIMVGQQFISNVIETLLPTALKWWKDRKEKKKALAEGYAEVEQPQWVDDYEGEMQTKFSLFWEYLEIVLQYGFVTMFVAGFPLAPVFALINNIFEIRVDSYNYVHNCRRPVAQRAEDIGAWYAILAALTQISVLINAFVLAFTSELIPNLVYYYKYSKDGTMAGFVDWSLSKFDVADFKNESIPLNATANGLPIQDQCRYPGYHDPKYPYDYSLVYWKILSARLAFVLCFVMFVLFVSWLVGYIIPDMPKTLELKIKREKFLAAQADQVHRKKKKNV